MRVIALGLNLQTTLDQDFPFEKLRHEANAQNMISFKLSFILKGDCPPIVFYCLIFTIPKKKNLPLTTLS